MGANFANTKWFDSATDEQRAALINSYDGLPTARKNVRAYVEQVVAEGQAKGVNYIDLTKEQRQRWKSASSSGLQRILDDTGPEGARLYDLLLEGKDAFSNQKNSAP